MDGVVSSATLHSPHGLETFGRTLFVCDSGNKAIRMITNGKPFKKLSDIFYKYAELFNLDHYRGPPRFYFDQGISIIDNVVAFLLTRGEETRERTGRTATQGPDQIIPHCTRRQYKVICKIYLLKRRKLYVNLPFHLDEAFARRNNEELWKIYRELRNKVTLDVRKAKCKYYTELFAEVKDCKSYWRLIKESACYKTSLPIMAMTGPGGETETSDLAIANILNEHFATIGEKLASGLPQAERRHPLANLSRVTPTVMTIDLTTDILKKALFKLKPDKASGPDHVSSKLLKYAGNVIILSLMSVFTASTASNSVPATWKLANVSSLYKSGDETDKHNYRPISLLSVPGKLMESCIGSIITTHITNHDLRSGNQWAYRKGYSTELLLVKMTEDWRTRWTVTWWWE
ncbi:hypothetical protein ACROYT_G030391 [Oculina patagonica]